MLQRLQEAWEGIAEASVEKNPGGRALLGMLVALQFTQILEPFLVRPPPEVGDLQVTAQVSLKNFCKCRMHCFQNPKKS